MFRYSLPKLFAAIFMIALFCVALATPTDWAADAAKVLTFLLLLSAVVGWVCSHGHTRAFAAGAAIFGWGMFCCLTDRNWRDVPFVTPTFDWAFVAIHGPAPDSVDAVDNEPATTIQEFMRQPRPGNGVITYRIADSPDAAPDETYSSRKRSFSEIAYMGLTMVFTIAGGVLGSFFYSRSVRTRVQ